MHRAYSTLEIKAIDESARVLTGIASTPEVDRMGDIVEPKGAEFSLPLPLLWQHDSKQPIGHVTAARVTDKGIEISAQLATVAEAGPLKDRLDNAWQTLKAGLVRGLSIGFQSREVARIENTDGLRFLKWLWLELSAVTIPANQSATISTIKSLDVGCPASEATEITRSLRPASRAAVRLVPRTAAKDPKMPKPLADQIKDLESSRAAKQAALEAIQTKASDEGRTKDAAEKESFDTLRDEIKGIDSELADLRDMESIQKASATPVSGKTAEDASRTRQNIVVVERKLPPGYMFARFAIVVGHSRGIGVEAIRLAKQYYPDDHAVQALVAKAAVHSGATTGSHWLDDMVPYNVMQDFIEFLRPGGIVTKFGGPNPGGGPNYPALNKVGFNERVSGMSAGLTAAWKGEGLPAIPSAAVTFATSLLYNNIAALAVLTKEAIRFSNPNAEPKVRDEIAKSINTRMDVDFIDPGKAAVGTTSPASITNGIVAIPPTGTTAAAFRTDLAGMLKTFTTANLGLGGLVLVMSESQAVELSLMINALGNPEFATINAQGGSLRGIPVMTSEYLQKLTNPAIVAVKPGEIYLADDGVVTVEASDQASLEMDSAPTQNGILGTGAALVSLWQNGLIGLLGQREITWKRRRLEAVQYIAPAAYAV